MHHDEWLSPGDIHDSLLESLKDPLFGRRLTVITASMMRGKTFHGRPLGGLFAPLDFINTAICKALSGKRRMRANGSGGLFHFLASCIESEISNTITGKESSMVGLAEPSVYSEEVATKTRPAPVHSIEEVILEEEQREELMSLFKEDPLLQALAELAVRDGLRGRKGFAELLNISEDDVTNLKKRMQRLYSAHLESSSRRKVHHA